MKTQTTPFRISYLLSIFLLIFGSGVYAQSGPNPGKAADDNMESLKIAYFTKHIQLTPAEAKVFWPVYNKYQAELKKVRLERNKRRKAAKDVYYSMSEQELEAYVDGEIISQQKEVDIKRKYHAQFKEILPLLKVGLLYKTEYEFKKKLLEKMKEKRAQQQSKK